MLSIWILLHDNISRVFKSMFSYFMLLDTGFCFWQVHHHKSSRWRILSCVFCVENWILAKIRPTRLTKPFDPFPFLLDCPFCFRSSCLMEVTVSLSLGYFCNRYDRQPNRLEDGTKELHASKYAAISSDTSRSTTYWKVSYSKVSNRQIAATDSAMRKSRLSITYPWSACNLLNLSVPQSRESPPGSANHYRSIYSPAGWSVQTWPVHNALSHSDQSLC